MANNWTVVVFCALEDCLARHSFVDYAVRDYILDNIDKFERWEKNTMIDMIKNALPKIKQDKLKFWADFMDELEAKNVV